MAPSARSFQDGESSRDAVLVNDPYVEKTSSRLLSMKFAASDYVVPLASATGETENLMNAAAFAKMKKTLIGASTWSTKPALEAALDAGRLAGCAMDVGRAPDQMAHAAARGAARRDRHAALPPGSPCGDRAPSRSRRWRRRPRY